ncbi:MAG: single-stranded-DNA-specific exonuclease RecJ [Sulfuricella sp.]|nr:single-stranded-DNA-specific exonuclease RecJ [Sulfuricella sp.]
MSRIRPRDYPAQVSEKLSEEGITPLLARVYAARGIASARQVEHEFAALFPYHLLRNAERMACLLADAIRLGQRILIVADYDSDGATACAVGMRALREFGANVDYLVPNRFEFGYGLTPEIVELAAAQRRPDILLTVDNGIASVEGVAAANRLGIAVLVTDHHLVGEEIPAAACIVNPNQPDCEFPSKNLAGVGVIFYVMLALRAELRKRGVFAAKPEPNLARFIDLVALGTVADVVRLDDNNRILVDQGLRRIRAGRACPGIQALLKVARRNADKASAQDLGFAVGPRLNAAGRLDDMALGIECLLSDDETRAMQLAEQLDALNRERREIETDMLKSAEAQVRQAEQDAKHLLDNVLAHRAAAPYTLCLSDPGWHQGVIGILASRIKDRLHRPVIAFAPSAEGILRGSGRAIRSLHLRDALDLVSKRHPRLLVRFGGHAAACGLTIREDDLAAFSDAFENVARELLTPADLDHTVETDGPLTPLEACLETALKLNAQVWGKGFPIPTFDDRFTVIRQRVVGEKHLRLTLANGPQNYDAILFSQTGPLPGKIRAAYRLDINEYNGSQNLQLVIEHWESV